MTISIIRNSRIILIAVCFVFQLSLCFAAGNLTIGASPQAVRKIVFDTHDNLWFGSFGLGLWKCENDKPVKVTAEGPEGIFPMINNMLLKDRVLWLATAGKGVQGFDTESGTLLPIGQANGHLKLHGLYQLSDGTLIAGSVGSGTSFLKDSDWLPISSDQPLHISWVNDFIEWNGSLWLGTSTGLYAQSFPLNNWKPSASGVNRPVNCLATRGDFLFIGTTRGFRRMNKDGEVFSESDVEGTIHALINFKDSLFAFGENGTWKISEAGTVRLPDFPDTVKCAAVNLKNSLYFGTTDGKIYKSDDGLNIQPVVEFTGTGFEELNK